MKQKDDWHITNEVHHEVGRGDPFAAAMRATRMPMVITDPRLPDNPIVFANQAFQDLTGYARDEVIGRNCRFLQGPDTDKEAVSKIRAAIKDEVDINIDILNYRKDGSTFWNALYLSPTRGDDGSLQFYFASQLDVSSRIEVQQILSQQKELVENEVRKRTIALQEALEAKTILLHEVDHRVKNNLTMIGSLLRLQARGVGDVQVAAKLNAMLERINALAAVHRRLYQSEDIRKFDVGAFASSLVSDVIGASGRTDIRLHQDVEAIEVESDKASALGLIINEVVTNAIKHGLDDGRAGSLTLRAKRAGASATIQIGDDGKGMAKGGVADGLGRTLIDRLSRQVGALCIWEDAQPGVQVTISFNL